MYSVVQRPVKTGKGRLHSFTLVELLVVMAIIGILTAITLQAVSGVMAAASRNRARAEVKAMEAALESYKVDNGAYPIASTMLTNSASAPYNSSSVDGSSTTYQSSSQILFQALTGKINLTDTTFTAAAGAKSYMSLKASQVGTGAGGSYVQDPWSYSYGYSTGTTNNAASPSYPNNGNGFFDLWSTGGLLAPMATNSAAWISNWQQ